MQRGVIIGVRPVLISADGTIGAAAGGAAGGVAGAQVSGGPIMTAFGAIGGALVGGIGGAAAEQAVADAKGWEYIVQETGEKLVSITQTSKIALPVGLHVLVIAGTQQARIVPDYTVPIAAASPTATAGGSAAAGMKPAATKTPKLLPRRTVPRPLRFTPARFRPPPVQRGLCRQPPSPRRALPQSRRRHIRLRPIPLRRPRHHLPRPAQPPRLRPSATRGRRRERLLPAPRPCLSSSRQKHRVPLPRRRPSRSRQERRAPRRQYVPPPRPRPEGPRRGAVRDDCRQAPVGLMATANSSPLR